MPANHRLLLRVDCADAISPEAFPWLETAGGARIEGRWVELAEAHEVHVGSAHFEFDGELPEGAEIQVRAAVPRTCTAPWISSRVSLDCEQVACVDRGSGLRDCCALHEAAGFAFGDRPSVGGASNDDGEEPHRGGAAGEGAEEGRTTYLRFSTGALDVEPPARPELSASCAEISGGSYLVRAHVSGDWDDVRSVAVEALGKQRVVALGEPCQGTETRSFDAARFSFYVEPGEASLLASVTDWSGMTVETSPVVLSVPEDCAGLVELAVPTHTCVQADFPVDSSCSPSPPSDVAEPDVCRAVERPVDEEEPGFEGPGLAPPPPDHEMDFTGDWDACSCRAAGLERRVSSSWMTFTGGLVVVSSLFRRARRAPQAPEAP